jgi:hypothetical protein
VRTLAYAASDPFDGEFELGSGWLVATFRVAFLRVVAGPAAASSDGPVPTAMR